MKKYTERDRKLMLELYMKVAKTGDVKARNTLIKRFENTDELINDMVKIINDEDLP